MCSEILLNSIVEQINKFICAYSYYTQEKRFKSIYKQDIEFPGKIRSMYCNYELSILNLDRCSVYYRPLGNSFLDMHIQAKSSRQWHG